MNRIILNQKALVSKRQYIHRAIKVEGMKYRRVSNIHIRLHESNPSTAKH